ncbi:MAG: hypothetical protein ABIO38_08725 [Luteimonas sp.]
MTPVYAQRPPAKIPASSETVLERLPKGYAALMPLQSRIATPPAMQAQQLLAAASRTGDARLATRADGLLQRLPSPSTDRQILRARAFSAQHRHDFTLALTLLDRLIALDARDGDARLARAQIHLLQGRLPKARSDCTTLALGIDSGRGLLCVAALSSRIGNYSAAIDVLDRWLQARQDDGLRRYALVMRAETASRIQASDADAWYQRALALDRDDVRTLASYARHLRAKGAHAQVMALLRNVPSHDGLQLQRALAAHALGDPEAPALARMQGRRYALARAAGSEPELRDEAEYMLTLARNPPAALRLAQRNFETQRDVEDVAILQRAAHAANRPQALQTLQSWASSNMLKLDSVSADDE